MILSPKTCILLRGIQKVVREIVAPTIRFETVMLVLVSRSRSENIKGKSKVAAESRVYKKM